MIPVRFLCRQCNELWFRFSGLKTLQICNKILKLSDEKISFIKLLLQFWCFYKNKNNLSIYIYILSIVVWNATFFFKCFGFLYLSPFLYNYPCINNKYQFLIVNLNIHGIDPNKTFIKIIICLDMLYLVYWSLRCEYIVNYICKVNTTSIVAYG